MNSKLINALPRFLDVLGLDEEPMGIFYSDEKPAKLDELDELGYELYELGSGHAKGLI